MKELWLKFKDENGKDRRVQVDSVSFSVGRHTTSDLSIPNGKLSREHIRIDQHGDDYLVVDSGSSNGTTLNGRPLTSQLALSNGDVLNLGGGVDVEIELISEDAADASEAVAVTADEAPPELFEGADSGAASVSVAATPSGTAASSSAEGPGGIPTSVFYIAPVLGVIILVMLCGVVYLASSGDTKKPDNEDISYTPVDRDTPPKNRDDPPGNGKSGKTSNDPTPSNSGNTSLDPGDPPPSPSNSDPIEVKCEQAGAKFLREIAINDSRAFLTSDQASAISSKVKQISTSSSLADNINSARRNSSQIKALAASKNMKPQFLAVAALAKLGNSRGDALQAAKDIADTLAKLGTQIGGELANETVLIIAAYDQGAKGDFMKMRNMLQDVTTKAPESAREIRTIWYLHKNGKIDDGEYNFALQFLAMGVITQNPKDFGVNAEALVL